LKLTEKLEIQIGNLLRARGLKLATAESCSGGLIADRITDIPGSSDYFRGGIESKGAVLVMDAATNRVIGTSRFYDFNVETNSIVIGYTFFGRAFWGGHFNPSLKKLMLDYVFGFVDKVYFHIGAVNIRSQTAISRLGARKVAEADIAYHGETSNANFIYEIVKSDWQSTNS
jgi:RimJ/RimL family protein N-acetyltransferase